MMARNNADYRQKRRRWLGIAFAIALLLTEGMFLWMGLP